MDIKLRIERESLNPMRLPHWRWDLVETLVAGRLPRHIGDPWIKRAVRYLKAHRDQKPGLGEAFPEVHAALAIFRGGGRTRVVLESWLLTGAALHQVAVAVGQPWETVEAYERLFFPIREIAGAKGAVLAAIRRSARATPDDLGPLGVTLREIAYHAGPLALKTVLPALEDCRRLLEVPDDETPLQEPLSACHFVLLASAVERGTLSLKQWEALWERAKVYETLRREREMLEGLLARDAGGRESETGQETNKPAARDEAGERRRPNAA